MEPTLKYQKIGYPCENYLAMKISVLTLGPWFTYGEK